MKNIISTLNDVYRDLYDGDSGLLYKWYQELQRRNESTLISDTFLMVIGKSSGDVYPLFTTYGDDVIVKTVFNYMISDKEKQHIVLENYPEPFHMFSKNGRFIRSDFFEYVFDLNLSRLLQILKKIVDDSQLLDINSLYKFIVFEVLCDYQIIPDVFYARNSYLQKIQTISKYLESLV